MDSVMQGATSAADSENKVQAALVAKLFLSVLLSVIVMMFSLILYAEDVLPHAEVGVNSPESAHALRGLIRLFCMAAATPVLFILGRPILRDIQLAQSWQEKATESLVFLGALSAFTLSVINTFYEGPKVYFETATVVLVLMTIGRGLDARAKQQAAKSLAKLSKSLPETVRVLDEDGLETQQAVDSVELGQRLRVKIGELIAVDGVVLQGESELDESAITGEFEAKQASQHAKVFAGSRNLSGELIIEARSQGGQGTIYQIEKLVKLAWSEPGYKVEMAQYWSRKLLPIALSLALIAGTFWGFYSADFMTGIQVTLSVLLIACPCALGIATPMALWRGLKECSQLGIFPRSGAILEDLSELDQLYIDKTGTLTEPQLQFNEQSQANHSLEAQSQPSHLELQRLAYVLASFSDHVISKAVQRNLRETKNELSSGPFGLDEASQAQRQQWIDEFELRAVTEVKGRGVQGQCQYGEVKLGSATFCSESSLADAANTPDVVLQLDGQRALSWQLVEALRPGAKQAVTRIKERGIEVVILSGDKEKRVAAVAKELSVKYFAECLPDEKMQKISQGAKNSVVGMLGDGLNDAPALAAATVGLALAEGLEVTRDCADGVIMGSDLRKFADLLDLCEEVGEQIRWNLTWAFLFNAIGLILAVTNQLNPVWAALAMLLSSSSIVASNIDREDERPDGQSAETSQSPIHQTSPLSTVSAPA